MSLQSVKRLAKAAKAVVDSKVTVDSSTITHVIQAKALTELDDAFSDLSEEDYYILGL